MERAQEQAFIDNFSLLHGNTDVTTSRVCGSVVAHVRRRREEVAPTRSSTKAKVKLGGFLVARRASLQTTHPQTLDPTWKLSRVRLFGGVASGAEKQANPLEFTIPLRP